MLRLHELLLGRSAVLGCILIILSACRSDQTPTAAPTTTPAAISDTHEPCVYEASLVNSPDQPLEVRPSQTLQPTWIVRNDGTCDWLGVSLTQLTPDDTDALSIPIPATAVKSSTQLIIDITAPAGIGTHVDQWQLRALDGSLFGPILKIEILVQALLPVTPQTPYGIVTDDGCVLDAAFVSDITLTDGTIAQPNQALQKVWRVQNIGTCNWAEGLSLTLISGDPMGVSETIGIPPALAGETVDIQVNFITPSQNGTYRSWWQLQSPDGALFGISLYSEISIGAPSAGGVPNQTRYTPFIHNISFHSRQIFLDGQTKGNRANAFAKVGDSITDVWAFLNPIGEGSYALYDYDYLQPAINYFSEAGLRTGNSFNNKSVAATWGWSSIDVLSDYYVSDTCPGMSSLACEYSLNKPAVAIILIGTNDALPSRDLALFEGNIRQMVEISIQNGVIPVLSTIPHSPIVDVQPYNQVIVTTAVAYDIPWMDFYSAIWELPNHGIDADAVHPSIPPGGNPAIFTPENLNYGHTVRNLLVLHVLDAVWRQVLAY